jgi:hypothetical protein
MSMRQRCENPNDLAYKNYGGRGISICERWKTFENFAADMGAMPDDHSLERIDVNGNYEPSNCRWATDLEQSRNTRKTRWIEYCGVRACLAEWSDRTGMRRGTISARLKNGWSVERALTAPLKLVEDPRRPCSVTQKSAHPVRAA